MQPEVGGVFGDLEARPEPRGGMGGLTGAAPLAAGPVVVAPASAVAPAPAPAFAPPVSGREDTSAPRSVVASVKGRALTPTRASASTIAAATSSTAAPGAGKAMRLGPEPETATAAAPALRAAAMAAMPPGMCSRRSA